MPMYMDIHDAPGAGVARRERDSGIRTVLFTDIVDSTSLIEHPVQ
jgi:hypothetical protein